MPGPKIFTYRRQDIGVLWKVIWQVTEGNPRREVEAAKCDPVLIVRQLSFQRESQRKNIKENIKEKPVLSTGTVSSGTR